MMIPRERLLFLFAVIAIPFSIAAGVAAPAVPLALVVSFLIVVVGDAVYARSVGTRVEVGLPAVVRMSKGRTAQVEVAFTRSSGRIREIVCAVPTPEGIRAGDDAMTVVLPEGEERSSVTWAFTADRRGRFRITFVCLEWSSPLGLWAVRRRPRVDCEIRVYPNLLTERKGLAALFLNRGGFGMHSVRQIGKGREFEKLREYSPGDLYEDVHWKATARRGRPVTKVFQIERTQEVYVAIDASRLSARTVEGVDGADVTTTLERHVTAALVMGLAAEQQGDLFGLITFSNRVETFIRARNGKAHYGACRDAIHALEPRTMNPDFEEVFTFLRLRQRRRALVVFLTALDDPGIADGFVDHVDLIARRHVVIANMLNPPGTARLFSREGVVSDDEIYDRLGGHIRWQGLCELGRVLHRRGVAFHTIENERLGAQLVSQYMNVKKRQLI